MTLRSALVESRFMKAVINKIEKGEAFRSENYSGEGFDEDALPDKSSKSNSTAPRQTQSKSLTFKSALLRKLINLLSSLEEKVLVLEQRRESIECREMKQNDYNIAEREYQ